MGLVLLVIPFTRDFALLSAPSRKASITKVLVAIIFAPLALDVSRKTIDVLA
jgi:hypothetical protein